MAVRSEHVEEVVCMKRLLNGIVGVYGSSFEVGVGLVVCGF